MSVRLLLITAGAFILIPRAPAVAQTAADSAAIRAAALDYIDGWYAADGARMERALHAELAKRNVTSDSTGRSRLTQMSAMTLVQLTRNGGGSRIPAPQRSNTVQILDIYGGAASVRVRAATWIDYMHLAKFNGRWQIVNVLWENDPPNR
jgi:putative lumazine-binding protein